MRVWGSFFRRIILVDETFKATVSPGRCAAIGVFSARHLVGSSLRAGHPEKRGCEFRWDVERKEVTVSIEEAEAKRSWEKRGIRFW
jgi:hypothetical protein